MTDSSPLDTLTQEMRDTLERALGDPSAVRTCVIVVETADPRAGQIVVSCSDSRRFVAEGLLREGIDQITQAKGKR